MMPAFSAPPGLVAHIEADRRHIADGDGDELHRPALGGQLLDTLIDAAGDFLRDGLAQQGVVEDGLGSHARDLL
jgi:hypothetical protein